MSDSSGDATCQACGGDVKISVVWKHGFPAALHFECTGCYYSGHAEMTPLPDGVEDPDQDTSLGKCDNCGASKGLRGRASCRSCGYVPEGSRA